MKKVISGFCLLVLFITTSVLNAQDIQIIAPVDTLTQPVGIYEMVIDFKIVNVSAEEQVVFEVRTINDLPIGWTSSLCFGLLCFAPNIDSVATTPDFSTDPVQPGDTLDTSIHVFTDQISKGNAHIQIEVATFANPADRETLDFYFITEPTVDVEEKIQLTGFKLFSNYPNPFNPGTTIRYNVPENSFVTLVVYDALGNRVSGLINQRQSAGEYSVYFNAENLSSGTYVYRLSAISEDGVVFTESKQMLLIK
ncbi:MAG: hypothetical protein Kow0098_06760 [Ignavibacteriaceae bacterium]